MKELTPTASSTPKKILRLRKRGSIHDYSSPLQSPIHPLQDNYSQSSEEKSDTDDEHPPRYSQAIRSKPGPQNRSPPKGNNQQKTVNKRPNAFTNSTFTGKMNAFIVIIVSLIGCLSFTYFTSAQTKEMPSIANLSKKYHHQQKDLWYAIESGVEDVVLYNNPSIFLFLYEKESTETIDELLNDISRYIECKLNDCDTKPIYITSEMYKDKNFLHDYGHFIEKYKKPLLEQSVMIIKNLEQMPGQLAQAFHSFCDRFNPLVNKSLFIFTMEVKELNEEPVKNARKILRHLWADLKDDIFEPLFTRITSIVENINKEQK